MSFEVKFSPVVIKHLGINMYSTLPPVLSELITNSYDADSTSVTITINQKDKYIEIYDNGCGMTAEELNSDFLKIGRNRRSTKPNKSPKFNREVTGKKGLGKLSVFGICKSIYVESCKNGKINAFEMNYDLLLSQGEKDEALKLDAIIDNKPTEKQSYSKIILKNLTRKSEIPVQNTANSLLNRLNIFSDNFKVIIKDEKESKDLTKEERDKLIYKDEQFSWIIPDDILNGKVKLDEATIHYIKTNNIKGKIFTTKETLADNLTGITLYARGKLANEPSFFGVKLSNYAYSYMSGTLEVDFIDQHVEDDNIATARNSLIWENDSMKQLELHLATLIRKLGSLWKDLRREQKKIEIEKSSAFNTKWYEKNNYGSQDKKLAEKITNLVIDSDMEISKATSLLNFVEGAFEFDTFIEYASEIEENVDANKLIKLLQDWEIIEAKEHYRLSIGRIETIEKFDKLISSDTLEVAKKGIETMHSFLNKFPWILEPRLSSFDEEVTYRNFLKEAFDDSSEPEDDRRIDFLCKGSGDTLYIIEIKRSKKIIGLKELDQIKSYQRFIKSKLEENDRGLTQVKAYIIGKESAKDKNVQEEIKESLMHNRFVLNYSQMLSQARKYHQEFIDAYEKTNNLKSLKNIN
ncbi:ATP-binding protein [Aliarcobacter cryaerophilus]|uniref:ATP-binding protein n=1 Tax=Aliarcobacter cryaerophilus TaxID=28198 RepID=UPI0021B5D6C2|nr:ATP-binding protein [Aliarcobacter cryaerophilus]MCT7488760.1 ATP-binding protein [Aliarcobacter cryaerophilus]